jgi:tetratricopeptide (TPR) repeat protein
LKTVVTIVLIFLCAHAPAQNRYIDSLNNDLLNGAVPAIRVAADTFALIREGLQSSTALINTGRLPLAIETIQDIQRMALAVNATADMVQLYYELGRAYSDQGSFDLALKFLYQSLDLREKNGWTIDDCKTYNQLGKTYLRMKDYQQAENFFNKGMPLCDSMNDNHVHVDVLINFALLHIARNDFSRAAAMIGRTETHCAKGCLPGQHVQLNFVRGRMELAREQYRNAEKIFREILRETADFEDDRPRIEALTSLAQIELKRKRYSNARNLLDEALELGEKNDRHELLLDVYKTLAQLAGAHDDFKAKAAWQKKYIDLTDVVYNERLMGKISSLEVEFAERENIRTIEEQKVLMALQEEAINKKKTMLLLGLVAVGLTVAVVALLIRGNRQRKRRNEGLDQEVRERTRELEENLLDGHRAMQDLEREMQETYRDVRAQIATLKGISQVGLLEYATEEERQHFLELQMVVEEMEQLNLELKKQIEEGEGGV